MRSHDVNRRVARALLVFSCFYLPACSASSDSSIGTVGSSGSAIDASTTTVWDVSGRSCVAPSERPIDAELLTFVEPAVAAPGDLIAYRVSLEELANAIGSEADAIESAWLDGNLDVLCWDGTAWEQVWSIFSSASEPLGDSPTPAGIELVEPAVSADVPFDLEAKVPMLLPPGGYLLQVRARAESNGERISVTLAQFFDVVGES